MGNGLLAFLVAISASAWIYNKLMRNTGGNTKNAATAAGICGALIFVVVFFIARMIL